MSALLGRRSIKLYKNIRCNVGLNSSIFSSVSSFEFSQSYRRAASRFLQKGRLCSLGGHERKLNTLSEGQIAGGLHKEQRRCVMDEAIAHGDQSGSSLTRMTLPMHQHVNGILKGIFLIDNIIQTATNAANRFCQQQKIDSKEIRGRPDAALCFLSSFDYLTFIQPIKLIDAMYVKANVSATSDHLLRVEVSVERNYPLVPDVFKLANSAQLSFITNDHQDWSRRYLVKSQKSYGETPGDIPRPQPTPSILKDSLDHAKDDSGELFPSGSSWSFIQPYDCIPPRLSFCRPEHVCKLMHDHSLIMAARFTQHDVACVHIGPIKFHENIKMGGVVMTSGEVVSTTSDVLTLSQSISLLSLVGAKMRRYCVAEGLFSYVPLSSAKERVSLQGQEILSGHDQRFIQDKDVHIQQNIIDSYVNALKKL